MRESDDTTTTRIAPHQCAPIATFIAAARGESCEMTEMASACFVQEIPVAEIDTVGNVCGTVELKLRRVPDVPEWDPQGNPPIGEALARGANRFIGYYKQPELTAQAIVDGEWFATGDVVRITPGGQMQIIDRVKQLVKLSQGEYISLTQATEYYGLADVVDFVFVHANPKHSEPIAIVWPKQKCIDEWTLRGITDVEHSETVAKEIVASLRKVHEQRALRGFERINHILVKLESPTVENGLLTPTLKAQLRKIEAKYKTELDALYATIG